MAPTSQRRFPTQGWFRRLTVSVRAKQLTERVSIDTREGTLIGEPGDWLITGIEGEQYPLRRQHLSSPLRPLIAEAKAPPPVDEK